MGNYILLLPLIIIIAGHYIDSLSLSFSFFLSPLALAFSILSRNIDVDLSSGLTWIDHECVQVEIPDGHVHAWHVIVSVPTPFFGCRVWITL